MVIPYANKITFPSSWLRTRRDHARFLNLIEVSVFLHQYQRERDSEAIVASIADYAVAYALAGEVLAETLGDLRKPLREALSRIQAMATAEAGVSRREIREALGLPDSTVRRWLTELVELEYLEVEAGKGGAGNKSRYRAADRDARQPVVLGLLTPEELAQKNMPTSQNMPTRHENQQGIVSPEGRLTRSRVAKAGFLRGSALRTLSRAKSLRSFVTPAAARGYGGLSTLRPPEPQGQAGALSRKTARLVRLYEEDLLVRYGERTSSGYRGHVRAFLTWLEARLALYGRRAGLEMKLRPHLLRHTCATHLLAGGASVRHVQSLLGHRSLRTTEIYTRVDVGDLHQVFERAHPRK